MAQAGAFSVLDFEITNASDEKVSCLGDSARRQRTAAACRAFQVAGQLLYEAEGEELMMILEEGFAAVSTEDLTIGLPRIAHSRMEEALGEIGVPHVEAGP